MKNRTDRFSGNRSCLALAAFTLFFLAATLGHSAVRYVDDNNCNANGPGTLASPYCSINEAIKQSSYGDDVLVLPGTYHEVSADIAMKSGVDLLSAQAERPVIISVEHKILYFKGVSDCRIEGFILDATNDTKARATVRIQNASNNVTVHDNIIKSAATPMGGLNLVGIQLEGQIVATISNNTIYNYDNNAIGTKSGGDINYSTVTIKGNTLQDSGYNGIRINGKFDTTNTVIIGGNNLSDGNLIINSGRAGLAKGSGIYLKNITSATIENNTIQNSTMAGIRLIDTTTVTPHIKGNIIHNNGYAGINFEGAVNITIGGDNYIHSNGEGGIATRNGINLSNSTITIKGNTIENNTNAGIRLYGLSGSNNTVTIGGSGINDGNTIINNGQFAGPDGAGIRLYRITQSAIQNNTIQGNLRAGILLIDSSSIAPHITGNAIHDNGNSGINIGGASALTIGPSNSIYNNAISGISFMVLKNPTYGGTAASQPVTITGNSIYGNTKAGIAFIDRVTGAITISGNEIYQNSRSGIAFFSASTTSVVDNDIHSHAVSAGIFTGDWTGSSSYDRDNPPTNVRYDRPTGPVVLTIKRNKVHDNRAGMRLDHASGTISNNLVVNNDTTGIRYSGDTVSPFTAFSAAWGISSITNNTVADNGTPGENAEGSGIAFDDIAYLAGRNFFDPARKDATQGDRTIRNNVVTYNVKAGIRDATCNDGRTYNLYYSNNGWATAVKPQTGSCSKGTAPFFTGNTGEIFVDPLFVDRIDYALQAGSPAIAGGSDGLDMGAYGGSDPITW